MFGWIIGIIIWSLVWAAVTSLIIETKGYDESWFWWGFFFGIFAALVALAKPPVILFEISEQLSKQNKKIGFVNEVDAYPLEELELIESTQKDLYSEDEMKYIQQLIASKKGNH